MLEDIGGKTEGQITSEALGRLGGAMVVLFSVGEALARYGAPAPAVAATVAALGALGIGRIVVEWRRAEPAYR